VTLQEKNLRAELTGSWHVKLPKCLPVAVGGGVYLNILLNVLTELLIILKDGKRGELHEESAQEIAQHTRPRRFAECKLDES
jgi:hypothetical protein